MQMFFYEFISKQRILYQYVILIAMSLLILFLLIWIYRDSPYLNNNFFKFYHKNLRGYLFSGFISVGSFLLSLHTFVIVNLKEKVFGTVEYLEVFKKASGSEIVKQCDLYKPLDNLSGFINSSIWLSIITAISQFTIGLSTNFYASIYCVWVSILTVIFMLYCLMVIRENIKILLHQNKNP